MRGDVGMPQQRNIKSVEAEKRFHSGEKLIDIARAMDVPEGTVRRWKSSQQWTSNANAAAKNGKSKTNTRNPNARLGNGNAKGNPGGSGGPPGNKKARTTGEYERIMFEDLTDDAERALISTPIDKYESQYLLIRTLEIRARRLMLEIKKLRDEPDGIVVDAITTVDGCASAEFTNRNKEMESWPGSSSTTSRDHTATVMRPALSRILELEEALTRVQARLQRALEVLHKMELDDERRSLERNRHELFKQKIAGVFDLEYLLSLDDFGHGA